MIMLTPTILLNGVSLLVFSYALIIILQKDFRTYKQASLATRICYCAAITASFAAAAECLGLGREPQLGSLLLNPVLAVGTVLRICRPSIKIGGIFGS